LLLVPEFLENFELSVREAECPIVIAVDFNAKSQEWGSPKEDNRRKALADVAASLGLAVCKHGRQATFVRGASMSHLDLTFVTQSAAKSIENWSILDEESLSLHKYLEYSLTTRRSSKTVQARIGCAYRKLDYQKLVEGLKRGPPPAGQSAEGLCNQTVKVADRSM